MEEITIKVKDLLLRIMLRWRYILICMIVFALALNFFSYYRSRKAVSTSERSKEENLKEKLSEDEQREAERLAIMYKAYQKNYDDTVNYLDGSIKMQLNPSDICTNVIQYRVDTKYSVTYPEIEKKDYSKDILNSIYYKLINDANCSEIARSIGDSIKSSYIKELITCTIQEDILSVSVMGRSYEECDKITDVLAREILSVIDNLKDEYGDFDFYDMGLQRFKSFNQEVLTAQRTQANTLKEIRTAITGIVDAVSSNQKDYFTSLVEEEDEESEGPDEQKAEVSDEKTAKVKLIRPKMILVGAAAGFLLCVLFCLCRLLLARRLISDDTIKRAYGIESLGNIRVTEQSGGIFSFVDRALIRFFASDSPDVSYEDKLDMITAGIRIMAQKKGIKDLYITGSSLDEGTLSFIDQIKGKLEKDIESVRCGRSIVQDPQSLEDMSGADALIMVEREDYSSLVEIDRECTLCRQNQVPVLGYITLL